MKLKNTPNSYGLVSVILHWSVAVLVFILLPLGLWMTTLDYYDPWYRKAPDIHRSLGVIAGILIGIRIIWRKFNPQPESADKPWEKNLTKLSHLLLYLIPFVLIVSGYLISSADGRAVEVFNWFSIPALLAGIENQENIAGQIHYILGLGLIFIILLHLVGALKHHFIDRDQTLTRIFGKEN